MVVMVVVEEVLVVMAGKKEGRRRSRNHTKKKKGGVHYLRREGGREGRKEKKAEWSEVGREILPCLGGVQGSLMLLPETDAKNPLSLPSYANLSFTPSLRPFYNPSLQCSLSVSSLNPLFPFSL